MGIAVSLRTRKMDSRRWDREGRPRPQADLEQSFDRNYWLAHCEGYRVDGDGGRIGFVEEVRPGPNHPQDTILAVRAGRLGRRVLLVATADVAFIVPRAEQVWLTATRIVGSEPAAAENDDQLGIRAKQRM